MGTSGLNGCPCPPRLPLRQEIRSGAPALPKHVAKITIYVVGYQRDYHLPIVEEARVTLFGDHKPADVVVGIATLCPDYLIEVDAVAVIDG